MEFGVFQLNLNSDEITCIESRSQQKIWGEEILSLALLGDAGKEGLLGLHSDFPKLPQSSSPQLRDPALPKTKGRARAAMAWGQLTR